MSRTGQVDAAGGSPGSIELRRLGTRPAFVRRPTSDTCLPSPARLVDRRLGELSTGMRLPAFSGDVRPGIPRHDTLRTVQFAEVTPGGQHFALPSTPAPGMPPVVAMPRLLGISTKFRPLWLLALGNGGAVFIGSGSVVLQRAVWPSAAYRGLSDQGSTVLPSGTPGAGNAFGSRLGGLVGGSVMLAVGTALSVAASVLFYRDARALSRRQRPANPVYTRPTLYFAAHQVGIALLVAHRPIIEAMRVGLPPDFLWVAVLPGAIGQAIFAVTQAQSFSSSEVLVGKMPLRYRAEISTAARVGVSLFLVVGALNGIPNRSAYLREAFRQLAQVSAVVSFSLPLTTARLNNIDPMRAIMSPGRVRGEWTAVQVFALYALARIISSVSAYFLAHGVWPPVPAVAGEPPPAPGWLGLPGPRASGAIDTDAVIAASFLVAFSFALAQYAFWHLRRDCVAQGRRQANLLFAAATACFVLGSSYRVVTERAKAVADFEGIMMAMPIGLVANGLAYWALPEMLVQSELQTGNCAIPYRYQVTEACRAGGLLSWSVWSAAAAVLGFPPILRQLMAWSGSILCIASMALPTASTRRRALGIGTPAQELPTYFSPQ